jgi:hypothetical protein
LKLLASPAWNALSAALFALGLHPALGLSERWPLLMPAVALLWLAGLLVRAPGSRARQLLALGAAVALAGLAFDAVRGLTGLLELAPGESASRFTETGPDGAPLGLRPLGFTLRFEGVDSDGAARLSVVRGDAGSDSLRLAPNRATSLGGLRVAQAGWKPASGAARLRLAVALGESTHDVVVSEDAPARVGALEIGVERYFPDFALDAKRQPFSRSDEPRNPGALLRVRSAGQDFRVFVLQALPGIHKQEGLEASFALTGIETQNLLQLRVTSAPAAAAVAFGLILGLAGLVLAVRSPRGIAVTETAALGALALVATLAQVDAGRVLHWSFATGRAPVPGVGLILGLALLAGLGAFLLLGLASLARGPRAASLGRSLLALAATLSVLGAGVTVARVPAAAGSRNAIAVALAAVLALLGAHALLSPSGWGARLFGVVRGLSLPAIGVAWLVTGWQAWQTTGGYDAATVRAAAATALLGLAAAEPAGFRRVAVLLFVWAASWLLVS